MNRKLQFLTMLLAIIAFPILGNSQSLSENFDGGTFPPALWTLESSTGTWDASTQTGDHTTDSTTFLRYDCYNASSGNVAKIVTPALKITSSDKTFSFWANYYLVSGTWGNASTLYVDVTNDDGTTWTLGTTNIISNMQDSGWFQTSIDLGSYESQNFVGDTVKVRFRGVSDYGSYNIGIDDVVGPAIDASFNELEVTAILGDFGGFNPSTSDSVRVIVKNNGLTDQTNIPMKYTLDGGSVVSGTMASLASFSADTFTFATTIDASSAGLHILKVYSALANDEDNTNDTLIKNIVSTINTPVPYTMSFPNPYDTHLELVHYSGSITDVNAEADKDTTGYGIFMTSNRTSYYVFAQADVEDAFTNTTQITEANFKVDATSNLYLNMSLDLKTQTAYSNCTWVRVMINDSIYAKTLDGDSVWKDNAAWQNLTFDLNAFAGTLFNLSIQGALKYNVAKAYPGNKVYIDNIKFFVPPINDIEISQLLDYYGGVVGTPTKPIKVIVKNLGVANQTNIPIKYKIDNGTVMTESMPALAALSTDTFTFASPITSSTVGNHTLMVYSSITGDEDPSNDTVNQNFVIYGNNTFPLNEDFESGFTYFDNDYFNVTDFLIDTILFHSGSQSVKNHYAANGSDKLHEAGSINLTSTTNPVLDFWHIAKLESPNYDKGFVEISTDNGQTWSVLPDSLYLGESTNYSNGYFDETSYSEWGGGNITPDNTWWKMERFSLASYKTDSVRVRFNLHSDSGVQYDGWSIDDVSIQEEPNPTADLGNDTAICGGSSFTLDAGSTVGYSFLWTFNGTDTLAATTKSITADSIGIYTVQVIGMASTAYDTIVVSGLPIITFNALQSSCPNSSSFALSGATPINGAYSGVGVDANGMFDPAIAGVGNHTITYTYTDTAGCINSATQMLTVNSLPIISTTAAANPVSYNNSTTITATASNTIGGISYLWYPNSLINGDSTTQTITTVNVVSVNSYYVNVYDSATACSNTDTLLLSYSGGPVSVNPISSPSTICNGDTTSLSAISGGGNGTLSFIWTSNPSGFNSTDENPQATASVDTWFIVAATDGTNFATDSVFVTVLPSPSASIITATSAICEGDSTFTIISFNGIAPFNYTINGTSISGINSYIDSSLVFPTNTVTYTITTVSDSSGCSSIGLVDSTILIVNPLPNVDLGADQNICNNHSVTLDAGAGFASYLWSTGATTQTITLDSNDFNVGNNDYSVEVVNNDNCNNSDTVTLIVDPCTGILTPTISGAEINVLPNPNNGQFQIDINGLENQTYNLGVFNSIGSNVFNKEFKYTGQSTQSFKLDFSTYPKGIYFIRLQSEGKIKVNRVIIQ